MAKAATQRTIVKQKKGIFAVYSDGTILIKGVTASYPNIGKARENTNDDGQTTSKYGSLFLMPKDTHGPAKDAIVAMMAALIKDRKDKNNKPLKVPASKKFLKNGDAVDDDGERVQPDECAGMWVISAREDNPPIIRGPKLDPETGKPERITPKKAESMFYGGCIVDAIIRPWFQNNKYGIRINAGLTAIQWKGKGERLGQARIGDEEIDETFEAADDEADDGGWEDDDEGEL